MSKYISEIGVLGCFGYIFLFFCWCMPSVMKVSEDVIEIVEDTLKLLHSLNSLHYINLIYNLSI